jgi:hypothetical protein
MEVGLHLRFVFIHVAHNLYNDVLRLLPMKLSVIGCPIKVVE